MPNLPPKFTPLIESANYVFFLKRSQWVQFVYFFLSLLCDIMPSSYAKLLLAKFCDFVFATVTFPLAIVSLCIYIGTEVEPARCSSI